MTVAALPSAADYLEDGVTTSFPAPFRFKSPSDLIVERIIGGEVAPLTFGIDYTVTGGATDSGGTVTRTAPTRGGILRIRRFTPRQQPMDYTVGDRFPAESHEGALDRQMLISQELDLAIADISARALRVPPGEKVKALPRASLRADKILGFDLNGAPVLYSPNISLLPPTPVSGGEGVPLHSYPGTSIAEDPNRWEHSNKQLEQAQDDTLNPSSPNFGKWIDIYAREGEGKRHADEWTGPDDNAIPQATDRITGQPVPRRFLAENGDTLIDCWSQNGEYFVADFPTAHNTDRLPGNLRSGARIRILPGARIRRAPRYTGVVYPPDLLRPLIFCGDPNSTPATIDANGQDLQQDVYLNNAIVRVGDGCFVSENHRWGYREHHNDISFNGFSDFYIDTIHFGSMSDGPYLGAGNIGGGSHNRRNKRGWVRIWADGFNQNNRNPVSVVSAEDTEIYFYARNFAKRGGAAALDPYNPNTGVSAPAGGVDIEPNVSFTIDPHVRNVKIRGIAEHSGSAAVALLLGSNDEYPTPTRGFDIKVIAIDCFRGAFATAGADSMRIGYDAILSGKAIDCYRPFEILAGCGITLRDFTATGSEAAGYIGYFGSRPGDFHMENVRLQEIGGNDSAAVQVRGWRGGSRRNVTVIDGGDKAFEYLSGLPIEGVVDDGLQFIKTGRAGVPVMNFGHYVNPSNGGADMRYGTMSERGLVSSLPNIGWMVPGARVKNIPGSGLFVAGQEFYADPALERGAPYIMRVSETNTSGVPIIDVQQQISGFIEDADLPASAVTASNIAAMRNMRMSKGRFKVIGANAVAVGTNVGPQFGVAVQTPFSGTQAFYAGVRIYPSGGSIDGVTYAAMYLGVWFSDTTGGQLGRAVPILGGAPGGAAFNFRYGDTVQILTPGSGGEAAIVYTPAGGSSITIFSGGINGSVPYQPLLVGGVVGESLRVSVW